MRVLLEAPDGPLRQGWPAALTLRVENPSAEYVLLDRATTNGPRDGTLAWRRRPLGVVVYDAGEDLYRHRSVHNAMSAVPLCSGLLRPGGAMEAFLVVKGLEPGPRSIEVTVSGHVLPEAELLARVYLPPEAFQGSETDYERPEALEALGGVSTCIARVAGCRAVEARGEAAAWVEEDVESPAAAALERVPGGRIVDRSRRLGGAWVVATADERLHLVRDERQLSLPPGILDLEALRHLDEEPPFRPLVLTFQGEAAQAFRSATPLPLSDRERGQQLLPSEALWDLLEAAGAAGLKVGWEPQTTVNEGLVVR